MSVIDFLNDSIEQNITLEKQVDFLRTTKIDNPKELAEVVRFLQKRMPQTPKLEDAIDICGTGGSGLARLNTSTITVFLLASMGISIAKHGNNAASGRFGGFDLLQALGVPTQLDAQELQTRFRRFNLAFLYAKQLHPSMRFFAEARAKLGQPTFMNTLGPLLSPVNAKRQMIGVSNPDHLQLVGGDITRARERASHSGSRFCDGTRRHNTFR